MLPKYCYADRKIKEHKGIVIHYFSAVNVDKDGFDPTNCGRLLLDLNRPKEQREWYTMSDYPNRMYASYHKLIDREGKVHDLVPEEFVAYHAGESEWKGVQGLNEYTLGFSLIATHDSDFTEQQYRTLNRLVKESKYIYGFGDKWVTGHEHVTKRKKDPGPLFDWTRICGHK